jgi:hypothetical protein
MSELTGVSIEPFRGDLEGLEKMAHSSWRDEYGLSSFPNLYRPAFLRFLFGRLEHADHLIAAYRDGEILCFLANVPHRFYYRGNVRQGVWSGLLVSRKEWLRRGLAAAVINEAIRVNEQYQYEFALATFETGHRSTLMLKKLQAEGKRVERMKRLRVVARILDLGRVAGSEKIKGWEKATIKLIGGDRKPGRSVAKAIRGYRETDLDDCLTLFNAYAEEIQLARVWEREELGWELAYPDVSQTLVYEKDGRVQGAINFLSHDHLGRTKERWAWINHLAYSHLSPGERLSFVQGFLHIIRGQGYIGAIDWTKNYYSLGPFYRAHFFPYFRAVDLYSWTFNPEISLSGVRECNEIVV